jgi:hypothetical protein
MVFSVNAIATGPNNFAAFKAMAIQQNGTTTATSAASIPTQSNGSSGSSVTRGASIAVAFIAAVFGFML